MDIAEAEEKEVYQFVGHLQVMKPMDQAKDR